MKKTILRNKRNENKYIEVKYYSDGHYYFNPYMEWNNGVKNYLGATLRQKKGYSRRGTKKYLIMLLEDYVEV